MACFLSLKTFWRARKYARRWVRLKVVKKSNIQAPEGSSRKVQIETRRTAQKALIEEILQEAEGFISATELHRRLQARGSKVGIATVYRQLNALAQSGEADTIEAAQGTIYRICEPYEHHHHLVCDNCGRAEEIQLPAEEWMRKVSQEHGYTMTRHVLEVFGLCPICQEDPSAQAASKGSET